MNNCHIYNSVHTYNILTITSQNWTFYDVESRLDDLTLTNKRFAGLIGVLVIMAAMSGFVGVMNFGAGLALLGMIGFLMLFGFITSMQFAVIVLLAVGMYVMLRLL